MWYVLQIAFFSYVVYLYRTEIAPDALLGHICLFAALLTYALTWIISKSIDLVKFTLPRLALLLIKGVSFSGILKPGHRRLREQGRRQLRI